MTVHKRRKVSATIRRELAAGGLCAYCVKPLPPNFHVDHVVPLSKGGTNERSNLVAACPSCNLRKSDKDWKPVQNHNQLFEDVNEIYRMLAVLGESLISHMDETALYLTEDIQRTEEINKQIRQAIVELTAFGVLLKNCRRCRRRKARWFA